MEPGGWMRDYAKLRSGVVGDVGEFVLGATPAAAHGPVPTYAVQVSAGEERPVRFSVPRAAFPGDAETVEITTAGLVKRGGAKVLSPPRHMRLVPRLDGHAELNIFRRPAGLPIAAIEVEVI
jgi:hypothetical protein